jgi:hypothetical protein
MDFLDITMGKMIKVGLQSLARSMNQRASSDSDILEELAAAAAATAVGNNLGWETSEKDARLAQKLGQLQPFIAVSPQECMGQLASSGPT